MLVRVRFVVILAITVVLAAGSSRWFRQDRIDPPRHGPDYSPPGIEIVTDKKFYEIGEFIACRGLVKFEKETRFPTITVSLIAKNTVYLNRIVTPDRADDPLENTFEVRLGPTRIPGKFSVQARSVAYPERRLGEKARVRENVVASESNRCVVQVRRMR
ncbi:MAG: hypothetical protein AB7I30_07220 [Isosphaeraceae bacterium]